MLFKFPIDLIRTIFNFLDIYYLVCLGMKINKTINNIIKTHSYWYYLYLYNIKNNLVITKLPSITNNEYYQDELNTILNKLTTIDTNYFYSIFDTTMKNVILDYTFTKKCIFNQLKDKWYTKLYLCKQMLITIKYNIYNIFVKMNRYYNSIIKNELNPNIYKYKLRNYKMNLLRYIKKIYHIDYTINNILTRLQLFPPDHELNTLIKKCKLYTMNHIDGYIYIHMNDLISIYMTSKYDILGLYCGEIVNDLRQGYGNYITINNEYYIGEFKNNLYHGKGLLIDEKENRFQGIWKSGILL